MNDQSPEYFKGLFKHFTMDNGGRTVKNKLAQPKPCADYLKRDVVAATAGHFCLKSLHVALRATRSLINCKNDISHLNVLLVLPHGKHVNHFFFLYCWRAIARQHTILYNRAKSAKFVGCKIGDMRSRFRF